MMTAIRPGVLVALLCLLMVSPLRPAQACGVCLSLAEDTLGDRLLSAHAIAVAAPSKTNPFAFSVLRIVSGDVSKLGDLPPIPFLVDSSLRAAVRSGGAGEVLMAFGVDGQKQRRSGTHMTWHRLFRVTEDRLRFVDALLTAGASWTVGQTNDPGKAAFFATYLAQDDPLLQDAALIELDRAPYRVLRGLGVYPPPMVLSGNLTRVERLAFAPVSIRLLAADDRARSREVLRAHYPSGLKTSGPALHAWALAAVETDGEEALALVTERLRSRETGDAARVQLIRALVDAGTVAPARRAEIAKAFAVSLDRSLSGAVWIAFALKSWNDASLTPVFERLLRRNDLNPAMAFALHAAVGVDR